MFVKRTLYNFKVLTFLLYNAKSKKQKKKKKEEEEEEEGKGGD
jgi:hypothetical protein